MNHQVRRFFTSFPCCKELGAQASYIRTGNFILAVQTTPATSTLSNPFSKG